MSCYHGDSSMEHSLKAYIHRLPSERLEWFLEQFYTDNLSEDYTYIVPYVEHILYCRRRDAQNGRTETER